MDKGKTVVNERIQLMKELCYKVFFQTEDGMKLLTLLEQQHFFSPVADPSKSEYLAFFNEGMNEMIRRLRGFGQTFIFEKTKQEQENTNRTFKD